MHSAIQKSATAGGPELFQNQNWKNLGDFLRKWPLSRCTLVCTMHLVLLKKSRLFGLLLSPISNPVTHLKKGVHCSNIMDGGQLHSMHFLATLDPPNLECTLYYLFNTASKKKSQFLRVKISNLPFQLQTPFQTSTRLDFVCCQWTFPRLPKVNSTSWFIH